MENISSARTLLHQATNNVVLESHSPLSLIERTTDTAKEIFCKLIIPSVKIGTTLAFLSLAKLHSITRTCAAIFIIGKTIILTSWFFFSKSLFLSRNDICILNPDKITKKDLITNLKRLGPKASITQEKVEGFLKKTRDAARKYGLSPLVVIQLDQRDTGVLLGIPCNSSISNSSIIFPTINDISFAEQEELDALICHELSHVKNKDSVFSIPSKTLFPSIADLIFLKFSIFSWQLLALFTVSKLFIHQIDQYQSRKMEKRADLDAVRIVGSTKGAIKLFRKAQEKNKKFMEKYETLILTSKIQNKWARKLHLYIGTWMIKPLFKVFSHAIADREGNERLDTAHPLLSERIRYLEEWEQKQVAE